MPTPPLSTTPTRPLATAPLPHLPSMAAPPLLTASTPDLPSTATPPVPTASTPDLPSTATPPLLTAHLPSAATPSVPTASTTDLSSTATLPLSTAPTANLPSTATPPLPVAPTPPLFKHYSMSSAESTDEFELITLNRLPSGSPISSPTIFTIPSPPISGSGASVPVTPISHLTVTSARRSPELWSITRPQAATSAPPPAVSSTISMATPSQTTVAALDRRNSPPSRPNLGS